MPLQMLLGVDLIEDMAESLSRNGRRLDIERKKRKRRPPKGRKFDAEAYYEAEKRAGLRELQPC